VDVASHGDEEKIMTQNQQHGGEFDSLVKVANYMERIRDGQLDPDLHVALLGAIINDFRLSHGLTRADLAEISKLDREIITKIEHGKYKASEIDDLWLASIGGALMIPAYLLVYVLRGLPKLPEKGIFKPAQKPVEQVDPKAHKEPKVQREPRPQPPKRTPKNYRPGLAF
jgi:transcriptional regulator with XRE-family HTH domain